MPKVDMDMDRGRIVAWHVAEGDTVEKGDPLFDIETDKAAMEVEAPAAGVLYHRADEGAEIAIGKPVAWLYGPDESVGANPVSPSGAEAAPVATTPPETVMSDAHAAAGASDAAPAQNAAAHGVRATPAARARARDGGVDIAQIAGSGPRGRVQAADVDAVATAPAPAEAGAQAPGQARSAGALAVSRRGGGTGVPVLLLHGFAADMTSWAPLEAHLPDRPLIRIDLPGHGRSAPQDVPDFATLAGLLRQTFDDLHLDRAHLVGHSLGGALALALADTRPRQVAGLTLIAPAGLGPQIDAAALAGICRATRAESLAPWLRTLVADPTLITDSYARLAMASRADPALRAAQTAMAEALFPDGTQGFDASGALDRLVPPARIVWGRADAVIPWSHALRAPGRVALHLFRQIGHMPQIECPEEVGQIVAGPL